MENNAAEEANSGSCVTESTVQPGISIPIIPIGCSLRLLEKRVEFCKGVSSRRSWRTVAGEIEKYRFC